MFWPDPTHQSTHPSPIHPPKGWGSLQRFQIFKQNWNISISSSAIEFWLILGVPPEGWEVVRGCPLHTCACTHTHTCTCMCTCIWHHRESLGFPQIQWGQPFAWNYHVYHACMCVRVHACMHVCVHMCGGHYPTTPTPIQATPTPRATGSPEHQNSRSLELMKIIWFCLKILYLWTFLNSYRL